ncbi:hypothetical protein FHS61_001000 [Altererythrobacter atlanticus]|uniref:Uncharacterized protein n=1 Tax=Croceibacterium atlanticum TaxID=1267766 RepID=A0A0F7KS64_9SPHN|nr:hypothetical protein [Croceibacterium atlanticum]AKH43298.1 hypothetical protein WYH_02266 [Croceibacterium atlanticum]MBB5731996.1 hypothetical protein [Croceibacterium atlanticum]
MNATGTASLTISELREFASFTADEQRFIERSLDVGLHRCDAFERWGGNRLEDGAIRVQYFNYRELRPLREVIPSEIYFDGVDDFMGPLIRIAAHDLAQEKIDSFSAFRFLYERLLGAQARPWLPGIFCAAAALPHIRPDRRKLLLQSLSEAAATAPGWSDREPAFYPEKVEAEPA